MANDTDLIVRLRAESEKLQRDLNKAKGRMSNFQSQSKKITGAIKAQLAGAFAIGAVTSFGAAVIQTTAEFEKLKAVLTNTLGSKSEAAKAFDMIQKFASSTPFSVLELTNSFVKLSNFGLKPSLNALRAYGDLASATGKSFDQLSEAIIDATTGEFERLKEFGIRSKKEGDKVTFTFKGVKTQVDFTSDSIRKYIESLGEVEGVSGGMAAISETLAGKLSNLEDSFINLKAAIGGVIAEPLSTFFQNISNILSGAELETVEDYQNAILKLNKDISALQKQDEEGLKAQIKILKGLVASYTQAIGVLNNTFGPQPTPGITIPEKKQSNGKSRTKTISSGQKRATPDTLVSDAFSQVPNIMDNINEVIKDKFEESRNTFKAGFFEIQQVITQSGQDIQAVFLNMGDLIAGGINAIISGFQVGKLQGAFEALKQFLGSALQQLGSALIAINTGKLALTKVPPPAGIAIGAGLIAVGAALSKSSQNNLSALSSTGGFSSPGFSGGGINGGQNINLSGQFRVRGADLVYVLDRERNITGRTG
jgi:hypothetical protein